MNYVLLYLAGMILTMIILWFVQLKLRLDGDNIDEIVCVYAVMVWPIAYVLTIGYYAVKFVSNYSNKVQDRLIARIRNRRWEEVNGESINYRTLPKKEKHPANPYQVG